MSIDFDLALQKQLTARQRKQNNVERIYSPRQIQQAFLESFELIGGVPRLAIWANDPANYGDFLKMMITLAPKGAAALLGENAGQVLEYRSNVPASPLNRPAAPAKEEDITDVE